MLNKSIVKILWARIAAATAIHAILTALVFEVCTFSSRSLSQSLTTRLLAMHFCAIAHGAPLFARVLLGQTAVGGNNGWCLLRCPSACRPHSNLTLSAKAVLAQLTTSSVASCATAFLLLRASHTYSTTISPEAALVPSSGAELTSGAAWWHTLLVLLSALAAAICDTARSVRRGEHDLQFPIVAADPEPLAALSDFLRGTLPRMVLGATKSAVEWLLACAGVALVLLPLLAQCMLFVVQRVIVGGGGGVGLDATAASTSPAWLTAIDDVASRPWQTCAPPLRVVLRAGICYACNYLLLQHGPTLLAKVLTTPLDFNRAAGYPPGDVSGTAAARGYGGGAAAAVADGSTQPSDINNSIGSSTSSFYGGGGAGGPDEQFTGFRSGSAHGEFSVMASDGVTPAAKLLVDTLSLGWQRALQDPDQRLALEQEGPTGDGLGGLRAAGTSGGGSGYNQGAGLSSGGPGDYGARAELDWVKIVNHQRRLASGLKRRLQVQQVQKYTLQKRGLLAALRRILGDLVHCGRTGCLDDDDSVPAPLRVPTFDEQDTSPQFSWLESVARALAWQHAASATWGPASVSGGGGGYGATYMGGGSGQPPSSRSGSSSSSSLLTGKRLRASLFQCGQWPRLREVGCLLLDSYTLQCHAYLAELQRLDVANAGLPGDLFHDASGGSAVSNGKVEWVSATMMEDLFVAKLNARENKFDRLAGALVEKVVRLLPASLRHVAWLVAPPATTTVPSLPPSSLQTLLWAIESLSRGLAFAPDDVLSGPGSGVGYLGEEDLSDELDPCGDDAAPRASLPAILTSLLALQLALEAIAQAAKLNAVIGRNGHQSAFPEHVAVGIAVDHALTLLVRELGHGLNAYAFPTQYAQRLQKYVGLAGL